ncbi:TonB-dependent receptor [Echinicola jeungdonensis]|uniref:SusC/RagA family TonB-linked outer membrane protein n=1 Tax=Echinicola jeungdonensis TaxID=709343 RepID=A0ABV5J8G4_9BACT|nr:TonB-dependent receptor [Echinicola jeungdonensis]MDN3669446.1 TonB-dependent receptor [Echinicola jeungdonensis]
MFRNFKLPSGMFKGSLLLTLSLGVLDHPQVLAFDETHKLKSGIELSTSSQTLEKTITGTVISSEDNLPLPGVSILVKGSSKGTVTDIDGKYTLEVPDENAVLIFSSIGFKKQEITVGERTTIDITMQMDTKQLGEVVVVGYGTQRRKDITGSVSSVSSKEFNTGISVAPEQLMQGKVAGVNIVQNSGQPGAPSTVRIRGVNSISAGNDPLYVIDGVPMQFGSANKFVSGMQGSSPFTSEGTNPLNSINPADIESIDILKDASATAIYGSRGANGVIIITTKSKSMGEAVTYDSYVGVSNIRKTLPVLSADEYRNYAESIDIPYPDEGANTFWQDEVFRTGLTHNHNVGFGGGNVSSSYRASFGHTSQEGILRSSGLKKYTGRFNGTHKAMEGKLRLGINMTYGKTNEDNTPISSNINNEGGNILKDAIRWAPTLPVRNSDGSFYQLGQLRINPVSWVEVDDERNTNLFLGNVDIAFDIMNDLTFKVNLGHTDENVERYTNMPATHPSGESEGGRASINKLRNFSSIMEATLTYNKNLSPNTNLNILGGYSFQRFVTQYTFTDANNFVSSSVKWNLIQSGNILANTSYKSANRLASVFGRANFRLKDRYMFTFTLRNDGSSRFGENNRWGLFPSGAFAWNINEEEFFKSNTIDNLKLRLGYGVTGNQEIPNDLYRQQLSIAGSSVYVLGGEAIPSVLPTNYANPDLQWEQTNQLNVGLDFGFLDGRLTGTIDYYEKYTNNLLLQFSTAAPSVVNTQWANVGKVENKGIEFALNAGLIVDRPVTWDMSFNVSHNKNEVVSLSNDQFSRDEIRTAPLSGVITPKDFSQIIKPGLSLGTFYGRKFTGFDENGMETYLDEDGVDGADLVVIGNAQPDLNFGMSHQWKWKNFDASVSLRGVVGNEVLNNTGAEFSYTNSFPGINILRSALDSDVSRDQTAQFSSRWLEDGSFLRLDNMNIGYNFDVSSLDFLGKARIYVTGQNLFVLTGYSGFDPEVRTNTNAGGPAAIGIDYLSYPRPRVFMLGGSISFK